MPTYNNDRINKENFVGVRLNDTMLDELNDASYHLNVRRSELVRTAIAVYLKRMKARGYES